MLDSLLGSQLGTTAKFAIAFLLVLGLIGITAIILKRFGGGRMPSSGGGRNRQPRLSVLDSAVVDAKRRLVLIRRDNSEHLLLIGGPSDVVVETNIVRTGPQAVTNLDRRPQLRNAPASDTDAMESSLVPEPAYDEPQGRGGEPVAAPAPRMRELRPQPEQEAAPRMRERQPAPRQERQERQERPEYDEAPYAAPARPEPQPEPAAFSPPPPLPPRAVAHPSAAPQVAAPAPQPRNEAQYNEMAQRLEAALRKPAAAPAPKAPEPRVNAPAPQPRQAAPVPQTRAMPATPAITPSSSAPAKDAPNPFDSLEAEMASLLGQDKKR